MTQERTGPAYLLAAAGVGVGLGVLGARVVLLRTGLCLVPWTFAGLGVGVGCRSLRGAAAAGGAFGFPLAFTFMVAVYDGNTPLVHYLAGFALLGVVGALCGIALGVTGRTAARVLSARRSR